MGGHHNVISRQECPGCHCVVDVIKTAGGAVFADHFRTAEDFCFWSDRSVPNKCRRAVRPIFPPPPEVPVEEDEQDEGVLLLTEDRE